MLEGIFPLPPSVHNYSGIVGTWCQRGIGRRRGVGQVQGRALSRAQVHHIQIFNKVNRVFYQNFYACMCISFIGLNILP